jgi:oxalate decarboxylase/phosphoglucose isomerase-like protein (cupin superfamily)
VHSGNVATSSRVISLPRIRDPRGSLTFIEGDNHLPFAIERAYWVYDVPGGEVRAGHAYRELEEFIVALSGSFDVVVQDGNGLETVTLNRSYEGLYVPPLHWRTLENFSTNAVCLVLASRHFDEADYIRDHDAFVAMVS